MKLIKTLIVAIFFIVAITFALQNQQAVTLNYYDLIPPFSVPVFLLVFFSVLLGILIAGFGDIYVRYSLRLRARKCEKQLKACRNELETLKKTRAAESAVPPEKSGEVTEEKEPEKQDTERPSQAVKTTEHA
ncbi:MAG: LapA family protein [Deltaproteobacteria bacterium]|nr:LapA family protein [Deltaproteobacteria bacterium]